MMYIHQREKWWEFRFDKEKVMNKLGPLRFRQGLMIGRMLSLNFELFRDEALLSTMSTELVRSFEIEGVSVELTQVRSSIAHRLGIDTAGLVPSSRYVDGIVEMLVDATFYWDKPLSDERLFGWHNTLFPTGRSGMQMIDVAKYRSCDVFVASGHIGEEKIHYEAPEPERVPDEMHRFIDWVNSEDDMDGVIKAGIAHLWFVSIHPFDDGNGRITRAITDMLLARSERSSKRFYSMSNQMKIMQKQYYAVLEATEKGDGDITEWLLWFLDCFDKAISSTEDMVSSVLAKSHFWVTHKDTELNERQRKVISMLFTGFLGKLTSKKWAKICKCDEETAMEDLRDLVAKGVLKEEDEGRGKFSYSLIETTQA